MSIMANDLSLRRLSQIVGLLLLLSIILCSATTLSAFAGFGGYISEKMLGNGVNEALHLGDGTNELTVLGSGPVVSTLPATSISMSGGGTATLRGDLSDLNGIQQADVWFIWGTSVSALTNTTPVSTVFATGEQTAIITGFNAKQDIYYQFRASTDGTSSGSVLFFSAADKGFDLLNTALPIIIALAILVFVFLATGNPIYALFGSLIGLVTFYIIRAMLDSIS